MKNPKPPQKFFERFLNNNLDELKEYLLTVEKDLVYSDRFDIPESLQQKFAGKKIGATTAMAHYYNVFTFDNDSIQNLKKALADATKEACDYYGIDYDGLDYQINGWFNVDYGTKYGNVLSLSDPYELKNLHDHMGGIGAPVFHGYYCVNAEPSITHYLIDRETPFENINKNNRLVLSETGHPHGIGNWDWDGPRITIAYDIAPKNKQYNTDRWVPLND